MVSPGRTWLKVRVWPTWMEYSDITATGTLLAAVFAPPLPQAEVPSTPTASIAAHASRFTSGSVRQSVENVTRSCPRKLAWARVQE
jgi:hypothetical protein